LYSVSFRRRRATRGNHFLRERENEKGFESSREKRMTNCKTVPQTSNMLNLTRAILSFSASAIWLVSAWCPTYEAYVSRC